VPATIPQHYPISCAQAAELLGVTPSTASRAAVAAGIGRKIGSVRLLEKADFQALSKKIRGKPGNPNFVTGNHFGKPPKQSGKKSRK
jgi:hypothetical protein